MGKNRTQNKIQNKAQSEAQTKTVHTSSGRGGASIVGPSSKSSAYVAGIWLALVMGVLPLLTHNGYSDILGAKYAAFAGTCGVMAAVMLAVNIRQLADAKTSRVRSLWGNLSLTDKGVLIFFIISVISTLQASPYVSQAFYGNEGRYNGLILNTVYTAFYFLISRELDCKPRYLYIFMASGLVVCLLGITDFFRLDLLYLHHGKSSDTFVSTIGNINWYTVFCGLMAAVSGGLFIFSQCQPRSRAALLAILAISLEAMLMGNSDNVYLFLGAMYAAAPFAAFRKKSETCRYAVTVSMLFTCMLVLLLISENYTGKMIPIDSALKLMGGSRVVGLMAVTAWAVTAWVCRMMGACSKADTGKARGNAGDSSKGSDSENGNIQMRHIITDDDMPNCSVKVWAIFVGVCAAVVAVIFIWANANAQLVTERWPQLSGYLVFNDEWGTYRGYVWRAALEEYACLAPIHQIFGTGPDTFGIYMVTLRYRDMVKATGYYYDSAHSEYIALLFTLGPVGLAAQLAIIAGTVKACFAGLLAGADRYRGIFAATGLAVTGYAAQAVININVPIVAPFFWAMIAMAQSAARRCISLKKTGDSHI